MKCDICGEREAVLFVQQVSESASIEVHLCAECAKERGLSASGDKVELSLGSLVSELFGGQNSSEKQKRVCPCCGTDVEDVKKSRKAGCPECYTAFRQEISAVFREAGIEAPYTGTLPKRLAGFRSVLTDRMELQVKLEKAVCAEEYEKAAVYRDRLKALEDTADGQ